MKHKQLIEDMAKASLEVSGGSWDLLNSPDIKDGAQYSRLLKMVLDQQEAALQVVLAECPCDMDKTVDPWCCAAGECVRGEDN